ncbi:MAG: lipoprotein [Pseudomonadota bacterium]
MPSRASTILVLAATTLLAVGLGGCGQKGPLYLPSPGTAAASTSSPPAQAASAPAPAPAASR